MIETTKLRLNQNLADDGRVQVCSNPEAYTKSPSRNDAAVRTETAENADEVPWPTMAEVQHENHERNLSKSQASPQ